MVSNNGDARELSMARAFVMTSMCIPHYRKASNYIAIGG